MVLTRKKILYILLITAFFNAVLRPSADSNITLFRLLIPVSLYYIGKCSARVFFLIMKVMIFFSVLSFLQFALVKYVFFPNVETLSVIHQIEYLFHIFCISIVVGLVLCLRMICDDSFHAEFLRFLSSILKFVIVVFSIYALLGRDPAQFLLFGNINDLGCIMTAGIAILLLDNKTNTFMKVFWIIVSCFWLLYNDSKLALFGGIVEIALFLIFKLSKSNEAGMKKMFKYTLILLGVLGVWLFINSSTVINNYGIRDITIEPIKNVLHGIFYSHSSSSVTYRANVIIGLITILKSSFFLGVGVGNSSLLLKYIIPDPYGTFSRFSFMASHIWWFEIMVDGGIVFAFMLIRGYIRTIKSYFASNNSDSLLFSQLIIMSFPLWSMSSSGLYTEFFTLSVLAFSIIEQREFSKMNIAQQ